MRPGPQSPDMKAFTRGSQYTGWREPIDGYFIAVLRDRRLAVAEATFEMGARDKRSPTSLADGHQGGKPADWEIPLDGKDETNLTASKRVFIHRRRASKYTFI
jgi:hypothetical protein